MFNLIVKISVFVLVFFQLYNLLLCPYWLHLLHFIFNGFLPALEGLTFSSAFLLLNFFVLLGGALNNGGSRGVEFFLGHNSFPLMGAIFGP